MLRVLAKSKNLFQLNEDYEPYIYTYAFHASGVIKYSNEANDKIFVLEAFVIGDLKFR